VAQGPLDLRDLEAAEHLVGPPVHDEKGGRNVDLVRPAKAERP
jgi:hypothetical protein